MPRSRSSSIESRSCGMCLRGSTAPVTSRMRSASVDLPWSMWAMIEKLRMRSIGRAQYCEGQVRWPNEARDCANGSPRSPSHRPERQCTPAPRVVPRLLEPETHDPAVAVAAAGQDRPLRFRARLRHRHGRRRREREGDPRPERQGDLLRRRRLLGAISLRCREVPEAGSWAPFQGFPNERWLDIRALHVLKPILAKRFDTCAAKGFDGVEADNVDGYANRTGFPLSGKDQLRFDTWIANAVRKRGMAIGLKNDLDQVQKLLPYFDFAVNEQCFQYRECKVLEHFIDHGKPVYGAEYELPLSKFCSKSVAMGFSTIRKRYSLRAYRKTCS